MRIPRRIRFDIQLWLSKYGVVELISAYLVPNACQWYDTYRTFYANDLEHSGIFAYEAVITTSGKPDSGSLTNALHASRAGGKVLFGSFGLVCEATILPNNFSSGG